MGKRVSGHFVAITFIVVAFFLVFLATVVVLKAFNLGNTTFSQTKALVGIIETGFGGYFGLVIASLFAESRD